MDLHTTEMTARFRAAVEQFRTAEPSAEAERLSLEQLVQMHGAESAHVLMLLMALITMVPLAGAGNIMGFGMLALAWTAWVQGQPLRLPRRVGTLSLSPRWSDRTLSTLAWIYEAADQHLRPRWSPLLHRVLRYWWSAWVALMVFIIFLPIPMGNVLPSVCVMLISLGWMFRDGVAMLLSMFVGLVAVTYSVVVGGGAFLAVWRVFT